MAESNINIQVGVKGLAALNRLEQQLNKINTGASKVQGKVPQAANNIRAFGAASNVGATAAKGLGTAIAGMLGPIATVTGAIALLNKSINTAFERQAAEQKIRNFTDSIGEYNAAIALAADSAQKFGLSQTEATAAIGDVYSRLKGLGFGLKEVGQIYQGFNAIAKQSGTSSEDAAGAFLQLSQALGSGKLQGDELRAILERMPTLAQRIADSMGVSAAAIRQMGQEGKISSEVIYKALAESADAAGDMNAKLTDAQRGFAALKQVADRLLVSFGNVFGPVMLKGVEAIVKVGQTMADWYDYIGKKVFPQLVKAVEPLRQALQDAFQGVDWEYIRTILQNVLIVQFKVLAQIVGNVANALAGVVRIFTALVNNPLTRMFGQMFNFVAEKVGLTRDRVGELKTEQDQATQSAKESLDQYSKMPEKVEDAKQKAKELKAAQEGVTKAITEATKQADQYAARQTAMLDGELSVLGAKLEAETAINNVMLQQAETRLKAATNDQERVAAANEVYNLTVRQAQLELQQTQARIAGAVRQAQLAVEMAQMKEREIAAEVQIAQAKGVANEHYFAALAAQREAVGMAQQHLDTTIKMAVEQQRAAQAIYDGKVAAAQAALETNRTAQAAGQAAQAAGQFAQNMAQAASSAQAVASAMGSNGSQGGRPAPGGILASFGAAGQNAYFKNQLKAKFDDLNRVYGNRPSQFQTRYQSIMAEMRAQADRYNAAVSAQAQKQAQKDWRKAVSGYANGGYVNQAQMAMVGEGGQPEYIIPANKMSQAMDNYAAGKRGAAVVPNSAQVNIKTGPVTQMNGVDYVTKADLTAATGNAVKQTLNILRSDPSVRRSIGVAR